MCTGINTSFEFISVSNPDMYLKELEKYLRDIGQTMKFGTTPARGGGFVSSITINNATYGSEGR